MHVPLYSLALFAHIVGVLGLFIAMGLQWTMTLLLRRAQTVTQVRTWTSLIGGISRFGPASGALLVAAGLYMTATAWGWLTPWIDVSLGAMVVMMALGMGLNTRRLRAIHQAAAAVEQPDAALPSSLRRLAGDPVLWVATQVVAGILVGIVFLMTTKPGLGGSLLAMGAAIALGAVVGGVSARARRRDMANANQTQTSMQPVGPR